MNSVISVIIPAYNASKYLAEAIESVLAQTYTRYEMIIIDDGSTDETHKVVEKYKGKVRYFYQANQGIGAARNKGVINAEGQYLAFLDADDYWTSDKLEKQKAILDKDQNKQMVFGFVQQFISPEIDESERQKWVCPETPMSGVHAGCMLIRKSDFNAVGGFRTDFKNAEFLEWYGRAQAIGLKSCMIEEILMYRRIHGMNTMLSANKDPQESLRAVRAILELKKRMAGEDK